MRRMDRDDKRSLIDGGERAGGGGDTSRAVMTDCSGVAVRTAAVTVRCTKDVDARTAFSSFAQFVGVQQSLFCAAPIATP